MFANTPWAILPDRLLELRAAKPVAGQGAAINTNPAYSSYQGTALIPIVGIIGKGISPLMRMFGGTSTVIAGQQFSAALNDPEVKQILLYIDSPGGTVDGTQALADSIMAGRGKKPIVALADGMMCSAAYWIGSAADRVFASSGTAQIGSIGVVSGHIDISGRETQLGIKTTEIAAGKFKRIASNYAPLSEDGRSSIQATVDYLYSLFVGHVAKARGVPENTVLQKMADGRILIGQQAVSAGLVDGIKTIDEILKGSSNMITQSNKPSNRATSNDGKEFLYQKAKAYQAANPGTDIMTAIRRVSDVSVASGFKVEDDRFELHSKAKAYQAKHPGVSYMAAFQAVTYGGDQ